jgi:hypothetical protein
VNQNQVVAKTGHLIAELGVLAIIQDSDTPEVTLK